MVNAILDAACWRGLELVVVFEFEGNGKTVEKIQDPDLGLEFGERWNCTCGMLEWVGRGATMGWDEERIEARSEKADE
mgnify:FL=1|tara:strand:- start:367 stop:600 length:234 start_codon:yes stop_codon:yes gene_type:complete